MGAETETLVGFLRDGQFFDFFVRLTNFYFPFGAFWWFTGFTMFAIIHSKTRNVGYSSGFTALFFITVSTTDLVQDTFARQSLLWVAGIMVLASGFYMYTAVRD